MTTSNGYEKAFMDWFRKLVSRAKMGSQSKTYYRLSRGYRGKPLTPQEMIARIDRTTQKTA